ncbi:MAG: sialate O-acetylesterase [Opitutaceae bacterium]
MKTKTLACALIKRTLQAFSFVSLLYAFNSAQAELSPHKIFSSGTVLQREQAIKIWGTGDVGEIIIASINDHLASSKVGTDGRWTINLPAMPAGGPYVLNLNTDDDKVVLRDVFIGDVWLCSGQSNMGWTMAKSKDAREEIAKANNPLIRLFHVERKASDTPLQGVQGRWLPADQYSVKNFSAVAWHFGNALQPEIDVPVGLVLSEVGGTLACNWTSEATLNGHPSIQLYRDRFENLKAEYPALMAEWEEAHKTNPNAIKPKDPAYRQPSGFYNGMIAPLQPLALKGVIWYQGESDSWEWQNYTQFFHDLIADWRSGFEAPELPFLYVMLAGYNGKEGVNENYPYIRDAQLKTLELPHTAMASALDVGEEHDIHPTNKKPVGERLALAALATVYNKNICYSGPIMKQVEIKGDTAVVHYNHICDGLMTDDGPLRSFQVAGEDKVFVPANAVIAGETVIVTSTDGSPITSVRYAWAGFPQSNLYNTAGLPATPFSTDTID